MRKRLTENLGLKVLSLVLAMMTWLVIVNIADPVTKKKINLEVEILNTKAISEINKVYEVIEGNMVEVTVKGKRSMVEQITSADLKATSDLSNLSLTNAANINVVLTKILPYPPDLDWGNQMLKITLEEKVIAPFRITVDTVGSEEEDFYLGDAEVTPNLIDVSGGESKISKIDTIRVKVDVNGADRDINAKVEPMAYDAKGNLIDASNLEFSSKSIKVRIPIFETKSVPIKTKITGEAAPGYRDVGIVFQPETIKLAGSKKALAKINEIQVNIDITDAYQDLEKEIRIEDYLPDDSLKVVEDDSFISVHIKIEKLVTKAIVFTDADIDITSLKQDDMEVSFLNSKQPYTVELMGLEEDLENLSAGGLGCFLDLTQLSEGEHYLKIQYKLPNEIEVLTDKIKVQIELTKIQDTIESDGITEPSDTTNPIVDE